MYNNNQFYSLIFHFTRPENIGLLVNNMIHTIFIISQELEEFIVFYII